MEQLTKLSILEKCGEALIATKDCVEIAKAMSVGVSKPNTKEIGNGTVLAVLGIQAGNALLDEINTNPSYRYVKPLVEQGRLLIGSDLVQQVLQSMVPSILTQVQADTLCAIGMSPHTYTAHEVEAVLYNPDGSEK